VLADEATTNGLATRLASIEESISHLDAKLSRQLNELVWFQRLSDVAAMDKVRFTGPPPQKPGQPVSPPGSNDVLISALTFLPRKYVGTRSLPLLVLAHGDIHGNVATEEELHIVREVLEQGYAVIAPDYRGSSGYGSEFWRLIDYGGQEIEDVHAARDFMLGRYEQIDRRRVGIIGWSHGGLIALLTAFAHPEDYHAIYAGVPVSDLVERIRILGPGYGQMFAAPHHLGKTVTEAPEEYRRRSPSFHAHKLAAPLLIHANTSDIDVQLPELQRLLAALNDAGKKFEHHIYTNAPGGHYFNRLDTPAAIESRKEIWRFLARHLRPPRPVK
jgi:dipeptidyl aminopeptidase/acylaminoacyl peptidase